MNNSAIRLASRSDARAISGLITPLADSFIAHEFVTTARAQFLESLSVSAVQRYFDSGFRYHVAEDGRSLVGVVGTRDDCHLYHLFVSEAAQGAGLARELWRVAEQACIAAGHRGDFTVNSSRFAVGLYLKLGFVRDGPEDDRGGIVAVPMRFARHAV